MTEENTGGTLEPYPKEGLRDIAREGMNVGLAAIPVIGGPAQALVDMVLEPSLNKRRDRWLSKLGDVVDELCRRVEGFDIESLAQNETFISAVVEASGIAVRTQNEEKLEMLRNCLINSAVDSSRGDFMTRQFLQFVNELEPQHFIVLGYLADPSAWYDNHGITRRVFTFVSHQQLINEARLPVEGEVLRIVLKGLSDRGLINTGSMTTNISEEAVWRGIATDLGRDLLRFVSLE